MSRILVTGAAGFVGANVTEALVSAGHEVVCLDRPGAPLPAGLVARVERLDADIRDRAACLAAAEACDAVIHGAAATPVDGQDITPSRRAFEVNLTGTINVVEACEAAGARLVHLGSAAVYGSADGPWLDEETTRPMPAGSYAVSKWAAETFVLSRRAFGLTATVLRLGSVFGPHERATGLRDTISAIHQVTSAALAGRAVRLPRPGPRDWIYAPDIAAAVLRAATMPVPPPGPINVALGHEWSVAEWCAALARRCGLVWTIDPQAPNVDFHGDRDRPPLAVHRMGRELGITPTYGLDAACDAYLAWLTEREDA